MLQVFAENVYLLHVSGILLVSADPLAFSSLFLSVSCFWLKNYPIQGVILLSECFSDKRGPDWFDVGIGIFFSLILLF